MKIFLASPHGFCAGVKRAISIVENILKIYSIPIYVHHEIVHNNYVVNDLCKRGVIFVKRISDVPDGKVLIFSAHGVSKTVREEAKSRNITVFDATCPLVAKVHMEVARASHYGRELVLIGHSGHPEVEGTMGQYNNAKGGIYLIKSKKDVLALKIKNEDYVSFATQTTLSIRDSSEIIYALRKRFPKIVGPRKDDICYATVNRQKAVLSLAEKTDVILIVGSKSSSNTNRLVELAKEMGKLTFLIEESINIQREWIKTTKCIGVAAGASAPNILVKNVIFRLKRLGGKEIIPLKGQEEKVTFDIPKELRLL